MHAIRPPVITRVTVQEHECHLGITFPDEARASQFGHDAAALLDQDVEVDIAPSNGGGLQGAWPGEPDGAGTPSEAAMLAKGIRHDFQGPLTVVRSFLDMALEEEQNGMSDRVRGYLQEALAGADRLQTMVEGIGELGTESQVGEHRPVDLEAALDDAVRNLGARPSAARVTLERGDLPTVEGDPGSLVRLLQKLLENALDQVDGDVTIRVDAVEEPDAWRIRVADDGPGVPEAEQEWIFDPLHRGSEAKGSGAGVGLAVSRRIAEAHGGTVGVDSRSGEGATFWFTLPRSGDLRG